jgi:hypothetical protein
MVKQGNPCLNNFSADFEKASYAAKIGKEIINLYHFLCHTKLNQKFIRLFFYTLRHQMLVGSGPPQPFRIPHP